MTESGGPRFAAGMRGAVWLAGADRLDFMHRMSTGPVATLKPGAGCASLITSDTGRVVDLVAVYHGPDGTLLVTSASHAAEVVADHLRPYILYGDNVRVTVATDQVALITLVDAPPGWLARALAADQRQRDRVEADRPPRRPGDEQAAATVAPTTAAVAADAAVDPAATPPATGDGLRWTMGTWRGNDLWRCRHPLPGGLDAEDLVAPLPALQLIGALRAAGAQELDHAGYDLERIAMALPAFDHEIGPALRTNPLELGLSGLVDFDKGCYIGQEVVARLDTYDKVQRRLAVVAADGPIAIGAPVVLPEAPSRAGPGRRHATGIITTAAAAGAVWRGLALVPRWAQSGAAAIGPPESATAATIRLV